MGLSVWMTQTQGMSRIYLSMHLQIFRQQPEIGERGFFGKLQRDYVLKEKKKHPNF